MATAPLITTSSRDPALATGSPWRGRLPLYAAFVAGLVIMFGVGAILYAAKLYPGRATTQATPTTAAAVTTPPAVIPLVAPQPGYQVSPEGTVRTLWRFQQVGALPAVLLLYTRDLISRLGASTLLDALAAYQPNFAGWVPSFGAPQVTPAGSVVAVTVTDGTGHKSRYSYVLVEKAGRWWIAYDSMLRDALRQAAQTAVQTRIDPYAPKTSAQALRAGATAVSDYLHESSAALSAVAPAR